MADGPLAFSLTRKFIRAAASSSCASLIPRAMLAKAEYVVVQQGNRVTGVLSLPEILVRPDAALQSIVRTAQLLIFSPAISLAEVASAFSRSGETAAAVVDSDGQIKGILTCQDVIRLMIAQAQLLEQERSAAKTASHAKDRFVASLSHEIRTFMASILGYASLLRDHVTDAKDLQDVGTIERNGKYLLEIVNDILDFAKIESGRVEIKCQPFPVGRMVNEVIALLEATAHERGIALRAEFPTPLPETISSDATRLRQVLLNLASNALKFTDAGSVTIRCQFAPEVSPPTLKFDVVDTGIGIGEELHQTLFEPFTQIDSHGDAGRGGTGLGLPISGRLAGLLGGRIEVQSGLGRGSTFTLLLPIDYQNGAPLCLHHEPGDEVRFTAPAGMDQTLAGVHVLVADDRRDLRFLVQRFLENAGARVTAVQDGQQVLDQLKCPDGPTFDLILLDMRMPIMDGFETLREMKKLNCRIPVIALTANAMDEDRENCLAAGCRQYLSKPLGADLLVQTIHEVLSLGDAVDG